MSLIETRSGRETFDCRFYELSRECRRLEKQYTGHCLLNLALNVVGTSPGRMGQ